ncbi:hypothetical protein ACPPVU_09560 [Mucilaginibacter sp. McL0603]|uniref:hypothetical protein n=1 Tax=Mucilaginibacter sp. McL0603 TaxID=3415670 RepID=UPI003CECA222
MSVYFTSFYPLRCTKSGLEAVEKYSFPEYIDGSCRREPDFQNDHPCITGLCRPGFSKKLQKGDKIIYTTNKMGVGTRKLVAILEVERIIEGHRDAADWYIEHDYSLPNNLMVQENKPYPLEQTHKMGGWNNWVDDSGSLSGWDNGYIKRSTESSIVAICHIWGNHKYLENPPEMTNEDLDKIFKRIPGTRTPPKLTPEEEKHFFEWLFTIKAN